MKTIDRLKSAAEIKLVQAFELITGRHAVVVEDNYGEFYVGIDLPLIMKSMGPLVRQQLWRDAPHCDVVGPFTDAHLATMYIRAFYLHEREAIDAYANQTRKIMRRAQNKLWERYNRSHHYALEVSQKLDIRQNVDNTKVVGKEVSHV